MRGSMRKNLGARWPEKISTRWPAHCHVAFHVYVAELKETARVPLPAQFTRLGYARSQLCSQRIYIFSERPVSDLIDCSQPTEGVVAR